ncbi:hypothetical protein SNEBB_010854 [Seison nebaliae]|nr:hypothetical protein SNEBB_010854 [Seison nebaliae]
MNRMCQLSGVETIDCEKLKSMIEQPKEKFLILDGRKRCEYASGHLRYAVSVHCCSLLKKRIKDGSVSIIPTIDECFQKKKSNSVSSILLPDITISEETIKNHFDNIVIYDAQSKDITFSSKSSMAKLLTEKLWRLFPDKIKLVIGGYESISRCIPQHCTSNSAASTPNPTTPHTRGDMMNTSSFSQPHLPSGPSRIYSGIFVGSQEDAVSSEKLKKFDIRWILNATHNGAKSILIKENQFKRLNVHDSFETKIIKHFEDTYNFINKALSSNEKILIHCLAGISRSPTIVIAFLMRKFGWTVQEAFHFVKKRRNGVAPNFSFLGQLQEYEERLKIEKIVFFPYVEELLPVVMEVNSSQSTPTSAGEKRTFSHNICEELKNEEKNYMKENEKNSTDNKVRMKKNNIGELTITRLSSTISSCSLDESMNISAIAPKRSKVTDKFITTIDTVKQEDIDQLRLNSFKRKTAYLVSEECSPKRSISCHEQPCQTVLQDQCQSADICLLKPFNTHTSPDDVDSHSGDSRTSLMVQ